MSKLKIKQQYQLDITTNIGCPNLCAYCPQDAIIQAYKNRSEESTLSFENFVGMLNNIPHHVHLNFSGFSGPWLNPECSRMLWYASHRGHTLSASTTLTGLKVADLDQIKHIRFKEFEVHLPGNKKRSEIKVDANYLETVKALLENPLHNLKWKFHRNDLEVDLHEELAPLFVVAEAEIEYSSINNRAGMVDTGTISPSPNVGKKLTPCPEFRKNILLPNGDVVLCHIDWSMQHTLGNLLIQSYDSLFESEAFQHILTALDDPSLPLLCRSCEKDIVRRNRLQRAKHKLKEGRTRRK